METKHLYLEAYSRWDNIKFANIKEESDPNMQPEDKELVLRNFLEKELGHRDARSVEIQRVH